MKKSELKSIVTEVINEADDYQEEDVANLFPSTLFDFIIQSYKKNNSPQVKMSLQNMGISEDMMEFAGIAMPPKENPGGGQVVVLKFKTYAGDVKKMKITAKVM